MVTNNAAGRVKGWRAACAFSASGMTSLDADSCRLFPSTTLFAATAISVGTSVDLFVVGFTLAVQGFQQRGPLVFKLRRVRGPVHFPQLLDADLGVDLCGR